MSTAHPTLVIRLATPDDATAVARLAALDSATVPTGPVLLAEVDGRPQVALPVAGGPPVADPFHDTADLVHLLRLRAARLRGEAPSRPAARGRARAALARVRG